MPKTTLLRKQITPTGTIQPHAGASAPEGYLVCDGTIVNIADYPTLYAIIGTSWGYGNNDGITFHLPDLRGRMLRGQDAGAGRDPDAGSRTAANAGGATGDAVGTVQSDAIRNISGNFQTIHSLGSGPFAATDNGNSTVEYSPNNNFRRYNVNFDASRSVPVAAENRPINANVNYVIKAV